MSAARDRTVDLEQGRQRLGRVGVWLSALGPLPAAAERECAQRIESLGYPSLWVNETYKEAFAHAALVLGSTSTLTVGTGVANVWRREPETAARGADTLAEAYEGRFVLGIGIGHARFDSAYRRPVSTMRDYLDRMLATPETDPRPATPVPWLVAALRPQMLELAATRAQGSHPYLGTVEHTALVRAQLGPDALLAPEVSVVLDPNPSTARATARRFLAGYLDLPNYVNNLRALGFAVEEFAGGGSDRLVDAVVAWGNLDAIKHRVEDHLAAGADHVAVQPLTADGRFPMRDLVELAPALVS
jgi:probable F420-dependent oxidoreductase